LNAGVASAKLTNPPSRIECRRRRDSGNRLTSNARDRDIDLTRVAPLTFRSPLKNRLSARAIWMTSLIVPATATQLTASVSDQEICLNEIHVF